MLRSRSSSPLSSRRDILHGTCHEPEGMYKRRVWELEKSMPAMVALYDKIKDVPNFIRDRPSETYTDLHYLLDPGVDYWMVDNVGVVVLKQTPSPLVT